MVKIEISPLMQTLRSPLKEKYSIKNHDSWTEKHLFNIGKSAEIGKGHLGPIYYNLNKVEKSLINVYISIFTSKT